MQGSLKLLILLITLFFTSIAIAGKAIVLEVSGPIGPAVQDYIERGIAHAKDEHASLVILQLNTPGGLETSMRGINQAIINSSVPIVTYVYPSGARAASAGLFIMYASHLAVMAPGTNAGAASPVNLFGNLKSTDSKELSTEEKKAVNDATAYLRSLAQLRDRNADWAELAVRQAASVSAEEAKRMKVIDDIADDYPTLLQKINGHTITIQHVPQKIDTTNLVLEKQSPDWRYQFLAFITDPNLVYVLMLVAMYGIFFELSNPGLVLPGVAGLIAMFIVLYALQLLPINYTGLILILIGVGFMIFEVMVSSFGVIGIGGVIAFIIGSIMLFDMNDANYHLNWSLIAVMSVITAVFFLMILKLAVQSQRHKIVSGREGLIGCEGVVLSVTNGNISVRVLGEIWDAKTNQSLNTGDKITVTNIEGLVLSVQRQGEEQ